MTYNYYNEMKRDILDRLINEEDITRAELLDGLKNDPDELKNKLADDLWICDSVTGNASGSYTFNSWTAREYVLDNMDLCGEMIQEFCIEAETIGQHFINEDWEWFDVSVRCYILPGVISEVIDDLTEALADILDNDDADILQALENKPKQTEIKKLIRSALHAEKTKGE